MLKYAAWPAGVAVVVGAGLLLDFRYAVLALFLVAAVASDLAAKRIPNALVYSGAVAALVSQTALPAGLGLWASVQGMLLGLVAFLPLYLLRAMGAGDVKLMAMVGGFVGPTLVLGAMLATLLAGGVMSLIVVLHMRRWGRLFENLRTMLLGRRGDAAPPGHATPAAASLGQLPYAVAIAAGTLGYLFILHAA